jgi:hypothetical protein
MPEAIAGDVRFTIYDSMKRTEGYLESINRAQRFRFDERRLGTWQIYSSNPAIVGHYQRQILRPP